MNLVQLTGKINMSRQTLFEAFNNSEIDVGNDAAPGLKRAAEIASYAVRVHPGVSRAIGRYDLRMSKDQQVSKVTNATPWDDKTPGFESHSIGENNNKIPAVISQGTSVRVHDAFPGTFLFTDPSDKTIRSVGRDNDPNLPGIPSTTVVASGNGASIPENLMRRFAGVSRIKYSAEAKKGDESNPQVSSTVVHGIVTYFNTTESTILAGTAVGVTLAGPVVRKNGGLAPAIQTIGDEEDAMRAYLYPISLYSFVEDWENACHAQDKLDNNRPHFNTDWAYDRPSNSDAAKHYRLKDEKNVNSTHGTNEMNWRARSVPASDTGLSAQAYASQNIANFYAAQQALMNDLGSYTHGALGPNFVPPEVGLTASMVWLATEFTSHAAMFYKDSTKKELMTPHVLAMKMYTAWHTAVMGNQMEYHHKIQKGALAFMTFAMNGCSEMAQTQRLGMVGVTTKDAKPFEATNILIAL